MVEEKKRTRRAAKKLAGRPTKDSLLPYKLLVIILYGRFKWIDRSEAGVVRIVSPLACHHMNVRRRMLYAAIETLDDWGIIKECKKTKYSLRVTPEVPKGMAINISEMTVESDEDVGVHLDVLLEQKEARNEQTASNKI